MPTPPPPLRLAAASLLLAILAACGGSAAPGATGDASPPPASGSPSAGAPSTAPPAGRSTPSTGTPAPGGSSRPSQPSGGQQYPTTLPPGATAKPPASPSPMPPLPFSASIEQDCVPLGGTQTVTVTTRPEAFVAYDAKYADGTAGDRHGGRETAGRADGSGRYSKSFTVAPTAPAGTVSLYVTAHVTGYKTGGKLLEFTVATTC